MAFLRSCIPQVRASVTAILKLRVTGPATPEGQPIEYGWGSAFCVVADRYLITAFHVLNGGQPREPAARYYALAVPKNGDPFFTFPVIGVPIERQDVDLAVLEIGPCTTPGVHVPALPVSFATQVDGTAVVTVGFPAPEVVTIGADTEANFTGGGFFLKSHANEGIVAASYLLQGQIPFYELNVGWHHGESGGPIATAARRPTVFSLMQHYRQVQGPHGILDGPRRGVALSVVQQELEALGVVGV